MTERKTLSPEEISALVDGLSSIDLEEIKLLVSLPPEKRWLVSHQKTEAIRNDLRQKLKADFPELSTPEINMKVLRSLSPVRMGKSYTEPAYYDCFR
jgi:hypothetical protein